MNCLTGPPPSPKRNKWVGKAFLLLTLITGKFLRSSEPAQEMWFKSVRHTTYFGVYILSTFWVSWQPDVGGLYGVVDNAIACHLCSPGSNLGQDMWQGSLFQVRWFCPGSPFLPTRLTTAPTSAATKTHS